MAFLSDAAAGILTPEAVGDLVIKPIAQQSVALQVSSVVQTQSAVFRIPIVDADAAAAWVPEGQDITPTDPTVGELLVTPLKVAALVRVSNELAEDSSPEAAGVVQDSLARSVARKLDQAFFAKTTPNGPSGLLNLTTSTVSAGSTFANLDWAVQAKTKLRKVGSEPTSFVASAGTVGDLSQIKSFTGQSTSNAPLLAVANVGENTAESVLGVPLVAVQDGTALTDGTIWAIDSRKVFAVIRRDVSLVVDPSFYFGSDSVAVRVTARVGFGFPHPEAIAKITTGGS